MSAVLSNILARKITLIRLPDNAVAQQIPSVDIRLLEFGHRETLTGQITQVERITGIAVRGAYVDEK